MSQTQINVIKGEVVEGKDFLSYIDIPSQINEKSHELASSGDCKKYNKSKRALFNRRTENSPKAQTSDSNESLRQVINLYYSLPAKERKITNEQLNNVFDSFFESLSDSDKELFIDKFSSYIQTLLPNCTTLSVNEKEDIEQFVQKLSSSEEPDHKSGEINNIMMILIKAFVDCMNTQGLDQLSQINDTTITNKYLEVAQSILRENMDNQKKMIDDIDKGSSGGTGFWIMVGITALTVLLAIVVPEFLPAEADLAVEAEAAEEGVAAAEETGAEVAEGGMEGVEGSTEETVASQEARLTNLTQKAESQVSKAESEAREAETQATQAKTKVTEANKEVKRIEDELQNIKESQVDRVPKVKDNVSAVKTRLQEAEKKLKESRKLFF